ncbi:hypothetical protein LRR18_12975 [Mangrovimonas sp. AS39]|uniref:hypothetical protein n=1 Tax=Mangrovimonas futianensis TaxID=2895523 RepID=UPI001E38D4BD|nr:hypothetical protein [Mangrovimonas futianensis]MCF1192501.1 hypothetical protein [Mangrovimonas futianensis]MCF1196169.1 hypothetical protein [Mangrovimonas futianensis]
MDISEKLPKNSSGLSGEYFVAAELYRRGFSVGLTIGNAKAIDILAEKDGKAFQIQVKTIRSKKSVGWPLMEHQIKENVIYILVNLNLEEQPDYYIMSPDEIRKFHKQYKTRGIVNMSPVHKEGSYLNNWKSINKF